MSSYFLTYNNKKIYIEDFKEEDILLDDIAHHLCNINRYGGSLPFDKFYSVAQHSVILADYILELTESIDMARRALLHDASEVYLGDIVSAVKRQLPDYAALEHKVQNTINQRFGIYVHGKANYLVGLYDKAILIDEVLALMPEKVDYYRESQPSLEEIGIIIVPQPDKNIVKQMFMNRCEAWGII